MHESRKLNGTGLIQNRRELRADVRADIILYKYAMQMVSGLLLLKYYANRLTHGLLI